MSNGINPDEHIGLVKVWANRLARQWNMDYEDLLGVCWEAMYKASIHFKPEYGFTFSTYACRAMAHNARQYMFVQKGRTVNGVKRSRRVHFGIEPDWQTDDRFCPQRDTEESEIRERAWSTWRDLREELPENTTEILELLGRGLHSKHIGALKGLSRTRILGILYESELGCSTMDFRELHHSTRRKKDAEYRARRKAEREAGKLTTIEQETPQ